MKHDEKRGPKQTLIRLLMQENLGNKAARAAGCTERRCGAQEATACGCSTSRLLRCNSLQPKLLCCNVRGSVSQWGGHAQVSLAVPGPVSGVFFKHCTVHSQTAARGH